MLKQASCTVVRLLCRLAEESQGGRGEGRMVVRLDRRAPLLLPASPASASHTFLWDEVLEGRGRGAGEQDQS